MHHRTYVLASLPIDPACLPTWPFRVFRCRCRSLLIRSISRALASLGLSIGLPATATTTTVRTYVCNITDRGL
ncbi:hypothetical protein EJ05DRAFT_113184 [Pseudovirgaria hyperparasitica]|uniref:Uncharacterized protein n=1 Tax=Pseudovirgaria hyperparasitica TaxID=470096 RepID=A0A6A6W298_9PEZI|nr:uncharacterized protein EJ05DRAFT_113184 [Pseudovirgaria hyperparasitica]KAF2755717.1 hypothetical protein EJ05DRAFT_113184 [Pseudovirgaria hyperparasitica]